jgi:putative salt-induced outer membrane protein
LTGCCGSGEKGSYPFGVTVVRQIALGLIGLATVPAAAEPIPAPVERMIDAVAGNEEQLQLVADVAKRANPASAAEIEAKVAGINEARTRAREERLANQGMMEGWSGQGEAGGFISTGNTTNRGLAVGITLTKETRRWKHAVRGIVDYQEQQGVTSRERYFAGYEGNWKFTRRGFVVLSLSAEQDRFTGFVSRFSQGIGIGYRLVDSEDLTVAIDGGPAVRQTRFTNGVNETSFAGRAALNAKWVISPRLTLSETATYFADDVNSSLLSLTQLTAKLNGSLSARASFQVNNEANPPPGRINTDTVTRATIVYSF